MTHIFLLEKNC